MSESILSEVNDGIQIITLNRPEKKNPITQAMYLQITEALKAADADKQVRVVMIRGAGGVFSAGNDMKDFSSAPTGEQTVLDSPAAQMMLAWIGLQKPIVAAVAGFAIGIGATCLLHCDSVIAGRGTRFQFPFTSLGLVPEFGSTLTLVNGGGKVKASHYLLTGDPFDAQVAQDIGMVSLVCDDDEVEALALKTCLRIASLSPASVKATKALINTSAYQQNMIGVFTEEMVMFRRGRESAEHREAVAAFMEKRPADFSQFG
ncbi:MAG: enoyl-CoA hydratase/isomerase family protein [Immundisolibacteraceae bacterium]|nr:enoyl-CoA hydratase/isomerase family protein [Immundisolibacteraceae bacterium]